LLGFAVLLLKHQLVAELAAKERFEILPMLDRIDHAEFLAALGRVRSGIHPAANLVRADVSSRGYLINQRLKHAVEDPVEHRIGLGTGAFAHEDFPGALVRAARAKE